MKKILLVLALCLLTLAICPLASAASVGVFDTTKDFLACLDDNDIKYSYMGVNENNRERVKITYTCDNFDSLVINCYFYESNDSAAFYAWDLANYHEVDLAKAAYNCNKINAEYRFVSFYCDESDKTVTAQMDTLFSGAENAGEIAYAAVKKMVSIIDEDEVVTLLREFAE